MPLVTQTSSKPVVRSFWFPLPRIVGEGQGDARAFAKCVVRRFIKSKWRTAANQSRPCYDCSLNVNWSSMFVFGSAFPPTSMCG